VTVVSVLYLADQLGAMRQEEPLVTWSGVAGMIQPGPPLDLFGCHRILDLLFGYRRSMGLIVTLLS
jgi:hypothetical protein